MQNKVSVTVIPAPDVRRYFRPVKTGFSLIELLVVVVIIGVLAAVGLVAYSGYIAATQDQATVADTTATGRAMETDHVAIANGLSARSNFSATLTADS